VIDPSRGVAARENVAFLNGRVVAVGDEVRPELGKEVIDCEGRVVTPGLIDLHVHTFEDVGPFGLPADQTSLARGVTTAIDAGTSGAETFAAFRIQIESSKTRVLAFLNISTIGQATGLGELLVPSYASVPNAVASIEVNRDLLVGVKVRLSRDLVVGREAGMTPLARTREVADAVGLPMMVHPQGAWCDSVEEVLAWMTPGDIFTHCFHGCEDRILDPSGSVRPAVREAAERGVVFDVGHGGGSFNWEVAERALAQGFFPTTISSDLHRGNIAGPVYDLTTTMSKFLHLGLSLSEVVERVTAAPARVLGILDEIGTLRVGACGDATVLEIREERSTLWDGEGQSRIAGAILEPVAVVRAGRLCATAHERAMTVAG
jgi:dihydroorotase